MLCSSSGFWRLNIAYNIQRAAAFVGTKHPCELCGRRKQSTDESKRLEFIKVLKEGDHAQRYSVHSSRVQSLSEEDLLERFRNLERLNVVNYDSLDVLPLLAKHPFTIRNRVELLLECGFQREMITVNCLTKYLTLVKQTIQTLKKQKYIPYHLDVMSHILQFVDLEPKYYPEEMLDRDATILKLRIEILRAFLKRRFGVADPEFKGQNITRLWNKSFGTINKNIRLIEDGVGIPTQSLKNNLYLLALNPANTETILREVKMVGNIDIYTALKARPKIICNSCGNLYKILKLLEKYNIPCVFNNGALNVLTFSYTTIEKRLQELDQIEYFSLNKHHPRIMSLITGQNLAKKRLKILEENNLLPASLSTLISSNQIFERLASDVLLHNHIAFRSNGLHPQVNLSLTMKHIASERHLVPIKWFLAEGHYQNQRDLLYFLTNQYGVGMPEMRKLLDKHPFWTTVSLVTVGRNHKFLSKHVPRSELVKNPLILFYPCERVQEEFFKLESRDNVDCCRGDDGRIKPEYVSPLMTYFLEKEANFTFQGIWMENDGVGTEGSDAPHFIVMPQEDQV